MKSSSGCDMWMTGGKRSRTFPLPPGSNYWSNYIIMLNYIIRDIFLFPKGSAVSEKKNISLWSIRIIISDNYICSDDVLNHSAEEQVLEKKDTFFFLARRIFNIFTGLAFSLLLLRGFSLLMWQNRLIGGGGVRVNSLRLLVWQRTDLVCWQRSK